MCETLFFSGCNFLWNNPWWDLDPDTTIIQLPDNQVVSLMKDFANKLNLKEQAIQPEVFQWHNFADLENTGYYISWYSIQKSGLKSEAIPNSTKFFDGRHVNHIWDGIGWSLIEYSNNDIICYQSLFYDQEIPYELLEWEWDYADGEFDKARDKFLEKVTYNTELTCWFMPEGAPTFSDLYFDAAWQEPFRNLSIRWQNLTRFDPENIEHYYTYSLTKNGDKFIFDWYNIHWYITKQDCIDSGKWDTHEYSIQVVREWDIAYIWCADKYDTDFIVWEEWTLQNFVKKTNYQYKWNSKRENISYVVFEMINNYMHVSLYEIEWNNYEPTQLIMEKTDNWRKVLYEWDGYDVDDDTCEDLLQYDNNLMEMFFLVYCPRG